MKVTTKLLSLLLVLVLVMTLTPAIARAEEADIEKGLVREEESVQINPLYEGIITEADLHFPELPELDPTQARPQGNTYLSVETAAVQFRKQMKNRAETFTIYVKSANSDFHAVAREVRDIALQHTGVATEGDYLAWQYKGFRDTGYYYYNHGTEMYEYDMTITISYFTTFEQEQELNTAVNNLINSLGVRYKSSYDKISTVYDWICENVAYDNANQEDDAYLLKHTAYAALVNKTAVREGYAVLFYRLMLELGVDARVIAADGSDPHVWNIVELKNLYFNVDATWDAGQEEYNWFLKSSWDFDNHQRKMKYNTVAFHNEFPMAAESYEAGKTPTKDPYICAGDMGENVENAQWWLGRDGTLSIKGSGNTCNFKNSLDRPDFAPWESEITKVVVEEGITGLGTYTFYEFSGLKEVSLPSTLKTIGLRAFYKCRNLQTVTCAEGLETIEARAFELCESLKTVKLPSTLKTIGVCAFEECNSLASITLPAGLESIGASAFAYCNGLKSITIPGSVSLGEKVFYCSGLETVIINEGVTELSRGLFEICDYLRTVKLPDSVKVIGTDAFSKCGALTSIILPANLEIIGSYAFYYCDLTSVEIPDTVMKIGGFAFSDNYNLTTVKLPEGLTVIEDYLFSDCGFTSINIPDSVTSIKSWAFAACNSLKTIVFPDSLQSIGEYAFQSCDGLTELVFPEGLVSIGASAFNECSSLKEVTFPDSLTSIGRDAFRYCHALTEVTIPAGVATVAGFNHCYNLKTVNLPERATKIDTYAFKFCQRLTDINLPEGLLTIGEEAFRGCTALPSIQIPKTVTHIDGNAFYGCKALTEITFSGSLPQMGSYALGDVRAIAYYPGNDPTWTEDKLQNYGGTITWVPMVMEIASGWSGATQWTLTDDGVLTVYGSGKTKNYGYGGGQPWLAYADQITSVVIEEGVTEIGTGTFMNLPALESVTLPEKGLTKIGEASFYGCTALKSIDIPETIYTIWRYTFKGCSALESVKLPKSLIKIDQGAFENCTGLPAITIPTNVDIIGSWSFKGCTGLVEADMRAAVATKIREGAFKNCSSLTEIILPVNIQTLGDSCFYGIGATSFTVPETVTSVEAWCFARAYSLTDLYFEGNAPAIGEGAFNKITLTVHYPAGNATWTADIMQNYGGTVAWTEN